MSLIHPSPSEFIDIEENHNHYLWMILKDKKCASIMKIGSFLFHLIDIYKDWMYFFTIPTYSILIAVL